MNQTPLSAVKSEIDELMAGFFRAVSFEAGQAPSYPALHALFIEAGLLIKNSGENPEICNLRQFIDPRQAAFDAAELMRFCEVELFETTDIFGNVAQRFSAYAKSGVLNGAAFVARGMISTQFVHTAAGWKISAMSWDDERAGLSMPERIARP